MGHAHIVLQHEIDLGRAECLDEACRLFGRKGAIDTGGPDINAGLDIGCAQMRAVRLIARQIAAVKTRSGGDPLRMGGRC